LGKLFRANYERYAAIANAENIQSAAEKLVADYLAFEKAAAGERRSWSNQLRATRLLCSDGRPPSPATTGAVATPK